ncbi:hypothetical protein [Amycolatopsis benzoatilytica]|uniref:hypothetical protein n=1 Tax=Amycolatopsis benzoatilytica TaxID=346045 RepID=UPI000363C478|nr:hypothetical protein [Amycolatopsis benzoatilytica]
MSDTAPTWGYVVVTGLAGVAGGLLVAALLVAGRTPQPTSQTSVPSSPAPSAEQVTVTVTGLPLPPVTVTHRAPPPAPRTTTATISVTPTPSSPSSPPPTSLSPTSVFASPGSDG